MMQAIERRRKLRHDHNQHLLTNAKFINVSQHRHASLYNHFTHQRLFPTTAEQRVLDLAASRGTLAAKIAVFDRYAQIISCYMTRHQFIERCIARATVIDLESAKLLAAADRSRGSILCGPHDHSPESHRRFAAHQNITRDSYDYLLGCGVHMHPVLNHIYGDATAHILTYMCDENVILPSLACRPVPNIEYSTFLVYCQLSPTPFDVIERVLERMYPTIDVLKRESIYHMYAANKNTRINDIKRVQTILGSRALPISGRLIEDCYADVAGYPDFIRVNLAFSLQLHQHTYDIVREIAIHWRHKSSPPGGRDYHEMLMSTT